MKKCQTVINPLRRDGTSQPQRYPVDINPDNIGIDERELEDFLVFVQQLAAEINFYKDNPSTTSGDWVTFFENDLSIVLAGISQTSLEVYQSAFLVQYDIMLGLLDDLFLLNQTIPPTASDPLAQKLADTFDAIYQIILIATSVPSMMGMVDGWLGKVGPETGLETLLLSQVNSEIRPALEDLAVIFYEIGAQFLSNTAIFPTPPTTVTDLISWNGFASELGDFPALFGSLTTASPVYFTGANDFEKVSRTLQGIKNNFEKFINAASLVISETRPYLLDSLNSYERHEPSAAMYLAFVQLFKYAQDHINELTLRHLLFYYQDVLQFQQRGAVADRAHLVLDLRDGVDDFRIEEGTRFYGGQDTTGEDRYYEASQEVVLNAAEVTEVKSVFVSELRENAISSPLEKGREIFAAPVANSLDGNGEALEDDSPFWNLMGEDQQGLSPTARTMSDGSIGFAVASPILFLQSGLRIVRFYFRFDKGNEISKLNTNYLSDLEVELSNSLKVRLSGEGEWVHTKPNKVFLITDATRLADLDNTGTDLKILYQIAGSPYQFEPMAPQLGTIDLTQYNYMMVELQLGSDQAAVLPYSPDLGGDYATDLPIAEFSFGNDGLSIARDGLPDFGIGAQLPGEFGKFGGGLVEYPAPLQSPRFIDQIVDYLAANYHPYDENQAYHHDPNVASNSDYVLYDEKIYRAAKNSSSPVPEGSLEYWSYQFIAPPVNTYTPYDPEATYAIGNLVTYNGDVYQAIKSSTSPLPDRNPEFWEEIDYTANPYVYLRDINLLEMDIRVEVFGHTNLVVENDSGPLNKDKPFEPFGFRPVKGNRFYIGSAEVFGKKLESFRLTYDWLDLPNNLNSYFADYANPPASNSDYQVKLALLEKGGFLSLSPVSHDLFHPTVAGVVHNIEVDMVNQSASLNPAFYGRETGMFENTNFSQDLKRGFLSLELEGPAIMFGHEAYAKEIADNALTPGNFPAEPITPKMKLFTIHYTSQVKVNLTSKAESVYRTRVEQFFHVHPFGQSEVHPATQIDGSGITLTPNYDEQGHLYIGVQDFDPPRTLGLLIQQLDGSGEPDLALSEVQWDVMVSNQWQSIPPVDVVWDSTNKLKRTGIVRFNLPRRISNDNTVLPAGLHWLRARIAENVAALNKAVTIRAQAIEVTFQDNGNDPEHFRNALPAGSIAELEFSRNQIDSVLQPYASFGGKIAEERDPFFTRVSERLRHKDRSSLVWDYERMVLEEYPEIFKAKCLNHTNDDCEITPGSVRVITVPNLRNKNAVNLFEPRTSLDLLGEIQSYLGETVSCFVDLKVMNPLYEQIKVHACIGFHTGFDPGYYLNQLKSDIQKFLSPWAFDEGAEIVFGGRIHRSVILNFIEERPYVDFVVKFRMDHIIGDMVCEDVLEAVTTTSRSILVTSTSHHLRAVTSCDHQCEGSVQYEGVDFWIVETDFEVQ